MTSNIDPVILEPIERIRHFGIECVGPVGDGIAFLAGYWKPGGEYIQKLIVRNVSTSVKKLKYKLPSTRYFSMEYPEVIVLSPGMFKEIDVVFRPVELAPYDDTIYIKMQEGEGSGGFHVPVKALISKLIVSAPFGIDMGYCTTHQTTTSTFLITNVGEIDAPFYWSSPAPFVLEPSEGVIPVGESQTITVSIFPQDASVFVSQASCHVGVDVEDAIIPEPILVTRLSAVGKYAYIVLSEPLVEFGEVLSGTPPESIVRDCLLRNNSVVPAEFVLKRHDEDRDEVFDITPKSGVIPPQSFVSVIIQYHSLAVGAFSLDRYTYQTPGDCRTTLTCRGFSIPPNISIRRDIIGMPRSNSATATCSDNGLLDEGSPMNSINFRDTEVGFTETRIFFLKNRSTRDTTFSILADHLGIFRIEPRQGVIPAELETPVKLHFTPTAPINFCRRIFILLADALPLYVDVMGTAYIRAKGEIKEQRPAPLRHAHVQAFRNRSVQGLGRLSPDELDLLYSNYYNDTESNMGMSNTLVSLGPGNVNVTELFAKVGRGGTRAMSIAAIQNPLTRTGDASRFQIAPAHEFFIEDTVDQSLVLASTFKTVVEEGDVLTAREIVISRSLIDFGYTPHNTISESQSITVTNTTHGKVSIQWFCPGIYGSADESKSASMAFSVEPNVADINAGKSQVFRVTFRPQQSNRNFVSELEAYVSFKNQRTFRLVNDTTMSPPWCLCVRASGHTFHSGQLLAKARLTSSGIRSGKLLFPCGFVNDYLYQTVILRNTSNLPSTFILNFGSEDSNELVKTSSGAVEDPTWSVKPISGEVAADDFVLVCIRFHPTEIKKYTQVLQCMVNGSDSGKVLLEGQGDVPYIVCTGVVADSNKTAPAAVKTNVMSTLTRTLKGFIGSFYMKPTCVGLTNTRKFTIFNASRLPLRYVVTLPTLPNAGVDEAPKVLSITPLKGVLRGKEETSLSITFAPYKAMKYVFKLKIAVYPVGGKCPPQVLDARQPGPVAPPEILQSISVNIICPAETGALLFDPPRMTADVRLVGTHETRDFYLENVSDSDISYQLFYKTEFMADSGSLIKTTVESEVMPLLLKKPEGDLENNLFCGEPVGILPARSRTLVPLTFHPSRAGLFEFLLFARIQSVVSVSNNRTLTIGMQDNEETAVNRVSQVDREEGVPGQGWESLRDIPLMANVTGRASFPTVVLEDIRCTSTDSHGVCAPVLVSAIDQLWRQFSMTSLNYDLSLPLTEEEALLNTNSSPDLSKLDRYSMEFTPNTVGSNRQTAYIQLRNSGFLTTHFSLHFPNEKTLDLEPWCDEDEPTEERLMHIAIIEELKCFTIEPRSAKLEPNETCILTLSYTYEHLKYGGLHTLPVLMKLHQGKMVWLDFIGRTLPSGDTMWSSPLLTNAGLPRRNESRSLVSAGMSSTSPVTQPHGAGANSNIPNIQLFPYVGSTSATTYWLHPVPLGLTSREAPKQVIPLVNVSGCDISYEADVSSLNQLTEDNFNLPLVRLSNPKGIIPARSTCYLEYIFHPLEVKVYEWNVVISYTHANPPQLPSMANAFANGTPVNGGHGRSKSTLTKPTTPHGRSSVATPAPPYVPLVRSLEFPVCVHGYDPREMTNNPPVLPESLYIGGCPPRVPLIQHKGVAAVADAANHAAAGEQPLAPPPPALARLSWDVISFGIVPQYTRSHRLVILHNVSTSSPIDFSIDDSSLSPLLLTSVGTEVSSVVNITPSYGRIDAGGHVVLHVELNSMKSQPLIFNEYVTITVREVIKSVAKKAHRNKLFDSIRKKEKSVEHASIVNRGTFARNMQIEENYVGEGRTAKLPTTFSNSGAVPAMTATSNPAMFSSSGVPGSTMNHSPPTSPSAFSRTGSEMLPPSSSGVEGGGGRNNSILLGPPALFNLRLTGSIMSLNIVNTVLNNHGPTAGIVNEFIIPPQLPFIHYRRENLPVTTPAMQLKADARASMKSTPSYFELNNASDNLSRSRLTGSQGNSRPGSSTLAIKSPAGSPRTTSSLDVGDALSKEREEELRNMSLHIVGELFKDLVSNVDSADAVQRAVSTYTGGLAFPSSSGCTGGEPVDEASAGIPQGAQAHGIYFAELVPPKPMLGRFVDELKSLGYKHSGMTFDSFHLGDEADAPTDVVCEKITAMDDVPDVQFSMTKVDLRAALIQMKIQKKGQCYASIDTKLYEKIGQEIRVSNLLESLPSSTLMMVEKKLNEMDIARNKKDILFDRTLSLSSNVAPSASRDNRPASGSLKHNASTSSLAAAKVDGNSMAAIQAIQNGTRSSAARSKANKLRDEATQQAADLALVERDGFLSLVGEILHNTMFNLIQESSYDEFQINADPLKLVVKK